MACLFILAAELKSQTIMLCAFIRSLLTAIKLIYVNNARTPHRLNYLFKDPSVGTERRIAEPSRAERSGAERRQTDAGAAGRSSPGWLLRFVF